MESWCTTRSSCFETATRPAFIFVSRTRGLRPGLPTKSPLRGSSTGKPPDSAIDGEENRSLRSAAEAAAAVGMTSEDWAPKPRCGGYDDTT